MKTFLALVIAGGLGILFYHQKHQERAPVAAQPAAPTAAPQAPATAQPRPVSEHNWMKRSLDRATDVRNQARTQTQESQNP